jgi:adenine deaminase
MFGLRDRGLVAPGQRADLVVIPSLEDCRARMVLSAGRVVDEKLFAARGEIAPVGRNSVRAPRVEAGDFAVRATGNSAHVIGVVPGRIITEHLQVDLAAEEGEFRVDTARDVIKVAVVERHGRNGNIAAGFVNGFGMKRGAIASTVGHDSHNICCVGCDEADMAVAVNRLSEIEGGFVVAEGGRVVAELALPMAGLMSLDDHETVRERLVVLRQAARDLGATLDEPFLQIAFLPLPVIPHLKITDRGLFDVDAFSFVAD